MTFPPERSSRRKVTIVRARAILLEEEIEKLIDNERLIEQAIERTEQTGMIFLDEIDKIAAPADGRSGADVSRQGVQRDLLPIVEGSTVSTRHGIVRTDQILFIAAGAFHVASVSDLMPELQGRFPIRVELESLTDAAIDLAASGATAQERSVAAYHALRTRVEPLLSAVEDDEDCGANLTRVVAE